MRLFYYYTPEENLYAVDPWKESIKMCQKHNLNNYYKSEYVPEKLPIPDLKFDLIYAFSVFTHLDKKSAIACFNTLSNYLSKNGVLIFTIRPPEFWNNRNTHVSKSLIQKKRNDLIKAHNENGFAFFGSGGTDSPHYGDASISIDWLKKKN